MTTDAVGGVWTYAVDLTRELGRRGVSVVLACLGPLPQTTQLATLDPGVELRTFPCRLEWMDDPWTDVDRSAAWLVQLERELKPDVVHVNGYAHAAARFRAPVLAVAHSCVLAWWEAVHAKPAPPAWDEYARRVGEGLRRARTVVALTKSGVRDLYRHHGARGRVRVISNGVDLHAFRPAEGPKEPFVLASGRVWDRAKNTSALLDVSPRLAWPVVVAGEGGDMVTPGGSTILGAIPRRELARWMSRAAIYAAPAYYEPFGLAVLEAALSGCALVLGDIPSLREIWGEAALWVAPHDREALAIALDSLAEDDDLRAWLAHRAWARARELSIAKTASAYVDLYAELAAAPSVEGRVG